MTTTMLVPLRHNRRFTAWPARQLPRTAPHPVDRRRGRGAVLPVAGPVPDPRHPFTVVAVAGVHLRLTAGPGTPRRLSRPAGRCAYRRRPPRPPRRPRVWPTRLSRICHPECGSDVWAGQGHHGERRRSRPASDGSAARRIAHVLLGRRSPWPRTRRRTRKTRRARRTRRSRTRWLVRSGRASHTGRLIVCNRRLRSSGQGAASSASTCGQPSARPAWSPLRVPPICKPSSVTPVGWYGYVPTRCPAPG